MLDMGAGDGSLLACLWETRTIDRTRRSVDWLKEWGHAGKIIVGSIREVINIQDAALAGAHVITVPPQFLEKLSDHPYSRATVRQFNEDAEKALAKVAELAAHRLVG